MGRIFLENMRNSEAEIHFREALRVTRDHKETLFKMAIAFADCEYFSTAAAIFENLLQMYQDLNVRDAVPYLAYCYFRLDDQPKFLEYIKTAALCNREITEDLFSSLFPGVQPEEYYLYAFQSVYGRFPKEGE